MTRAWRATEDLAAATLGGRRHPRRFGVSSPDVTLEDLGLVVECKTRKRLPRLVLEALRQAEGYAMRGFGQRPAAVLRETGSPLAVAVVWLHDLAALLRATLPQEGRPCEAGPSPSPSPDRAVAPPDRKKQHPSSPSRERAGRSGGPGTRGSAGGRGPLVNQPVDPAERREPNGGTV